MRSGTQCAPAPGSVSVPRPAGRPWMNAHRHTHTLRSCWPGIRPLGPGGSHGKQPVRRSPEQEGLRVETRPAACRATASNASSAGAPPTSRLSPYRADVRSSRATAACSCRRMRAAGEFADQEADAEHHAERQHVPRVRHGEGEVRRHEEEVVRADAEPGGEELLAPPSRTAAIITASGREHLGIRNRHGGTDAEGQQGRRGDDSGGFHVAAQMRGVPLPGRAIASVGARPSPATPESRARDVATAAHNLVEQRPPQPVAQARVGGVCQSGCGSRSVCAPSPAAPWRRARRSGARCPRRATRPGEDARRAGRDPPR